MTSSRIVRGTKARVFLYICAVLFVTGLIACYNNVRIQLDETHKQFDQCRQEQENLSSQLQVIYDYKQRLEKSLKTEKTDYQRIKAEMELKVNEEKLKGDKTNEDAKLRFSTLQQHFNLLQTQHEDFKEESSKIQKEQLDEINNLQAKLKEVKEQLKLAANEKENSINHLKTQNELLQKEKDKLLEAAKKDKSSKPTARTEITSTDFNKLLSIGGSQYIVDNSNKAKHEVNEETRGVLAKPSSAAPFNTSTPDSIVLPLKSPTATPESKKLTSSAKPLPPGVVPAPHQMIDDVKDTISKDLKDGNVLNEDKIEVFNSNNEVKKINQEDDFAMADDDYDNEDPQGNMELPIRE